MLVNGDGELTGLLTDKDIRNRVVATELDTQQPVKSVMSRKLIKIDADTMAFEAGLLMMRHNIHHLPVVVDNRPVGLISTTDLLKLSNQSPVYTISEIAKAGHGQSAGRDQHKHTGYIVSAGRQRTGGLSGRPGDQYPG